MTVEAYIYAVVGASSGQLENQTLSTAGHGSKEQGKLGQRLPDPQAKQCVVGLGPFASE